jgi:XTP/dITP diphosphohydrolase
VRRTLLVASHNSGKIAEYTDLLADLPLQVTSLSEQGVDFEAPETGATFGANACQKAAVYAKLTGLWTWADDSGLEVDALDGRPGVLSARYGGAGLNDGDRIRLLLAELAGVASPDRGARFRCAVCIVDPEGSRILTEDTVEGMIATAPAGEHGFGYDPVFYMPDLELTMAQLPPDVKNEISHRGKAARAAKAELGRLLSA